MSHTGTTSPSRRRKSVSGPLDAFACEGPLDERLSLTSSMVGEEGGSRPADRGVVGIAGEAAGTSVPRHQHAFVVESEDGVVGRLQDGLEERLAKDTGVRRLLGLVDVQI